MDKSIFRKIVGCYQNRNPLQAFCGDYLRWSHFLIKTYYYSLQPRTLLNSFTDDFMMIFWNSFTKNFGKYPGKHMSFTFNENAWLQSTAYYWTKTSITDTFQEKLRRERMFENFEKSIKPLQNCLFFSKATGLQSRTFGLKKTDSKKNVSC